jgi:F-type H+-transporting ATPase subunit alpha
LGVLPAVDVAKSVSRVGSAAQRAPYRSVAGQLKLAYSQFEELEAFSRFGTRLDEPTQRVIGRGQRIRACLGQPQFAAVPVLEQIVLLQSLTGGLLDAIALERVAAAQAALRAATAQMPDALRQRCLAGVWDAADCTAVAQIAAAALAPLKP